ncbi:MAG: amidohydrolase [Candidatus Abyssobacteria bacterium SURF_5]|uniref:Amidohydrolase n=1 Tax=Abyssobacteria bacterium (strain SURF_5) TaxID=2093360 RepID=A0A3A4PAJ1_ABYX5|nr:MAG: amidohydrolase [Candidatus Abyssubacteria bacterium SURF_5]
MRDAERNEFAETIFWGGDIITVDDANPTAEALAVANGKIVAVGDREQVLEFKGPATETIDLQGKTLMPGLVEPHSHPVISALLYDWIDVSGFTNASGAEVIEKLKQAAERAKPGEWIAAFGYDPILIRDLKALSADLLDEISRRNPIFIMIQSMHTVYVNHLALEIAGITDDSPQPEGGIFVKDKSGRLTGMIIEQAAIASVMMPILLESQAKGFDLIERQIQRYAKAGYTTVGAMGVFPVFLNWQNILRELVERDDCPIRMTIVEKATDLEQGITVDLGSASDRLRSGGAKFWYDGSFGTGNVYLDKPYLNSRLMQQGLGIPENTSGYPTMSKQKLKELVRKYHDQGRQIVIHGQGDRAIRDMIDVYEAVLAESPRQDHRHRIEHGGLFPIDQMERAARLGLTASWHVDYIYYYGEALRDEIIGSERARISYPVGAAEKRGLLNSLHNDSPMYPVEPFRLIQTAVTRKTRNGETIGEEQALSVDEAIKAVTINAAWQLFLEDKVGSLQVGKLADMVVLSENPRKIEPDRLDQIRVIETYRDGRRFRFQ